MAIKSKDVKKAAKKAVKQVKAAASSAVERAGELARPAVKKVQKEAKAGAKAIKKAAAPAAAKAKKAVRNAAKDALNASAKGLARAARRFKKRRVRYADLHTHTIYSDGTRTPREVVDLAKTHRLEILAISDHDHIGAFFEIAAHARSVGVTLVPAIELSCGHEGIDVHVLAYAFDPLHDGLEARLLGFREARARRGHQIVQRLHRLGVPVDERRVEELAASGAMGRPHVARALVEAGHCSSVSDAFDRYLGNGKPAYVEKERFQIDEAVALIRSAGGVTSIAHPTLYPDHEALVPHLLDLGIDAVEVMHPDVGEPDRERYTNLARFRGKFVTGGSDDHGTVKTRETLGTVRVPESLIGPILERI